MGESVFDIGGKIGLDLTDLKTDVKTAGQQIRLLESAFQATAAGLHDWTKDATGLESRITSLSRQIEAQKQKLAGYQEGYRKLAESGKASKKALADFQITINRETGTLNRMQRELVDSKSALDSLGQETKTTTKDTNDLSKSEERAADSTNHLGNTLGKLGGAMRGAASGMAGLAANTARMAGQVAAGALGLATAAAAAVVGLAATTIGPASDLAETANKINVTFGDAAGGVNAFASNAATQFGQTQQQALDAAATFGTFGKSAGLSGQGLADFSTQFVGLASDFASFYNTSPEQAIDAIGAALRGESEPIRAYGILLDDATLRQAAFEAGIVQTTSEALTPQQKVLAASAVIQKQSADAQGDFARTSGGLANQQRILAAQIENLRAKLGTGLLPVVTMVATTLNNWLGNSAFQAGIANFASGLEQVSKILAAGFGTGKVDGIAAGFRALGSVSPMLGRVGNVLAMVTTKVAEMITAFRSGGLKGLFEAIMPEGGVGALAEGIGGMIGQVLASMAGRQAQMMSVALSLLNGLAGAIMALLPTLLPMAMQLIQSLVRFMTQGLPLLMQAGLQIVMALINGVVPMLPTLVTTAIQMIATLASGIAAALPQLIPVIAQVIPQIILALIQALPLLIGAALQIIVALVQGLIQALPILISYIPQILTAIVLAIIAALLMLYDAARQIDQALADGLTSALPIIGDAALGIINTVVDAVSSFLAPIIDVGAQIVTGIWEGMQSMAAWFTERVMAFFADIVTNAKKALGIASPSRVFAGIGENMALGLGTGFSQAFTGVQNQVAGAMEELSSAGNGLGMQVVTMPAAVAGSGGAERIELWFQSPLSDSEMRRMAQYTFEEAERRRRR